MEIHIFSNVLHASWNKILFNNMKKKQEKKMKKVLQGA